MKFVSTLALAGALAMTAATPAQADAHMDKSAEPASDGIPGPEQDPYIWLEEARSDEALAWVEKENELTLAQMEADPRFEQLKAEALAIYDSEDRVPYVSFRPDGLYNFWQDKENPKGLLRRTTLESYKTDNPEWETVLDIDALDSVCWKAMRLSCRPSAMARCRSTRPKAARPRRSKCAAALPKWAMPV